MGISEAERHIQREVLIPSGNVHLEGNLLVPAQTCGLILFVHGSGSRSVSPHHQFIAHTLQQNRIGTLLCGLLTIEEEEEDRYTGHLRFDLALMAKRLSDVTHWLQRQDGCPSSPIGYFGSSTGAGAALLVAATLGNRIAVVISCGGRPDLAGDALAAVTAPTLLLACGRDESLIELHQQAYAKLHCKKQLAVVEGATHRFAEPGVMEEVARRTAEWCQKHFL